MQPSNTDSRVRESFARQEFMRTLGAVIVSVADGEVHIRMLASPQITQQHGFAHAGAIASIADSACGYACYSKMPDDSAVLSIEYKINMLAPAIGESFLAIGRVVRAGRTIFVARADVFAEGGEGEPKCIAVMQATMMRLESRDGLTA